jgi:hypothetical protein
VIGTTQRLSNLRQDCLIRDGHRCVISHQFDYREAANRLKRDGDNAKDDDGRMLKHDRERPEYLEVAHILPHSLMSLAASGRDPVLVYIISNVDVSSSLTNSFRVTQSKLP